MSAKSVITKRKKVYVLILCSLIILIGLLRFITVANAEEKAEKNIYTYLAERRVNYSSISVAGKVLTAELFSYGTDRCTLDDVKAIQAIYEAVHGKNVIGDVEDIKIIIYNLEGDVIYDYYEADVASRVENIDTFAAADVADGNKITDRSVLAEIRSIAAAYPFTVGEITSSDENVISGKKVEIKLKELEPGTVTMSSLNSLYTELEAYSFSTDAITQCTLYVMNDDDDCLLYMAGDFEFGNCIAWVSPAVEDSVIGQEGPRQ